MVSYPYKPKTAPSVLALLLFSALTAASIYLALTHTGGLLINGLIHLSSRSTTILFILISAMFGSMAIIGLLSVKNSFSSSRWIELSNGLLSIPKSGHSNSITKIKTANIKSLSIQQIQNHHILKITHKHGITTMHSAMFPSAMAFERMCESIQRALKVNG